MSHDVTFDTGKHCDKDQKVKIFSFFRWCFGWCWLTEYVYSQKFKIISLPNEMPKLSSFFRDPFSMYRWAKFWNWRNFLTNWDYEHVRVKIYSQLVQHLVAQNLLWYRWPLLIPVPSRHSVWWKKFWNWFFGKISDLYF